MYVCLRRTISLTVKYNKVLCSHRRSMQKLAAAAADARRRRDRCGRRVARQSSTPATAAAEVDDDDAGLERTDAARRERSAVSCACLSTDDFETKPATNRQKSANVSRLRWNHVTKCDSCSGSPFSLFAPSLRSHTADMHGVQGGSTIVWDFLYLNFFEVREFGGLSSLLTNSLQLLAIQHWASFAVCAGVLDWHQIVIAIHLKKTTIIVLNFRIATSSLPCKSRNEGIKI